MIASVQPTLLDQWRHYLGGRHRRNRPRPLAALGYLANGPVLDGLIEIDKLTLIILYDAPLGRGQCALRLAGFGGAAVPWGVKWGGPEQSRFLKDLSLQPVPEARGLRLDMASTELLQVGLHLNRRNDRHVRYPQLPVAPHIRLPKLWAGFLRSDAATITGYGPELEAYCRRTGKPTQYLLERLRREHYGLALFPLSWTSHHWQQAVAIFADLARFPQRQVFPLRHWPDDLIGFQDATAFDFVHTRFQQRHGRRPRSARRVVLAAATA